MIPRLNSLMFQVSISVVLCISAIIFVYGQYNYSLTKSSLELDLNQKLQMSANRLATTLRLPFFQYDKLAIIENIKSEMNDPIVVSVAIEDLSLGKISYAFARRNNSIVPADDLAPDEQWLKMSRLVTSGNDDLARVYVYVTPEHMNEELSSLRLQNIILTLVVCSALVIVLIFVLRYKLIVPIQRLTSASAAISQGDLESDINIQTSVGELATLENNFIGMRNNVKDTIVDLSVKNSDLENARFEIEVYRDYLENVLNAMPSSLVCVDNDLIIRLWNKEALSHTESDQKELSGKHLFEIFPYLREREEMLIDVIDSQVPESELKVRSVTSSGELYFDYIVYPLKSTEINGAVIRIDNVSDRVQMESVMVQSEKMSSVAGLAAGMAHEINNPLAGIMQGYQNILNRLNPDNQKNQKVAENFNLNLSDMYNYLEDRRIITFLKGGRDSCERAAQIVRNMLMFSRKSDSTLKMVDLRQLIEHTIELGSTDYDMKKKYDFKFIDIVKEYDPNLPAVKCCASEIEQVLLNLFKNALQAMEGIETEGYTPKFHVRLLKERKYVRIEVEDNGGGMSEHVRNHIFDPFFTTKPTGVGTGLGLSVSYMIVTQNHGGTFEVESEVGHGSKFIIRLPI